MGMEDDYARVPTMNQVISAIQTQKNSIIDKNPLPNTKKSVVSETANLNQDNDQLLEYKLEEVQSRNQVSN